MLEDCLTQRAESLIAAVSRERHQLLAERVREISGQMNSRGIFPSSIHVNEVANVCAAELNEIASAAWDCVRRAHESRGARENAKVLPYFLRVIEAEGAKAEAVLQQAVGSIAAGLQNKSMVPMREVREAQEHLAAKYTTEIEIYVANLSREAGSTVLERWTHRIKNNRVLAFVALVAAGVAGAAAFSDALGKLATSVKGMFGDG